MLLERRLVKILEDYYIRKPTGINRQEFIIYITNKLKWHRFNYFLKKDEFSNKIVRLLIDCIDGEYITESDGVINVTTKGRDFIKLGGFIEEVLKKRGRLHRGLLQILSGATIGAIITWLLTQSQYFREL